MVPVVVPDGPLVLARPALVPRRRPPLAVLGDVLVGWPLLRFRPRLVWVLLAERLVPRPLDGGTPRVPGLVPFERPRDAVLVPLAQSLLFPRVVVSLRPLPGVLHQLFELPQALVAPVEQPLPDGPELDVRPHAEPLQHRVAEIQPRQPPPLPLKHLQTRQPL